MIMRFTLERRAPAVADVDDTGILPGRNDYAFACSGKAAKMDARRLVGAMLRPHHREDPELNKTRLAAHERLDTFKLFRCEIVSGYYFRSDRFHKKVGRRQEAVSRMQKAESRKEQAMMFRCDLIRCPESAASGS